MLGDLVKFKEVNISMQTKVTNSRWLVWATLGILIFQFVADFIAFNYYQASFSLIRCICYFLIIFVLALGLVSVGKKLIGKKYELALAFTIGFCLLFIFDNYVVEATLRTLMGEHFRFRFVILADGLAILLFSGLAFLISQFKTFSYAFLGTLFCMSLFNLFSIENQAVRYEALDVKEYTSFAKTSDSSLKNKPNVYYLVPDAFTGTEMFNQLSDIKLSIDKDLEKRGFRVIHNAYANASATLLSLPQVYSMNYLFKEGDVINGKKLTELGNLYQQESPVTREFRRRGYKFYRLADAMTGHCFGTEDKCIRKLSLLTTQDIVFMNRTLIPSVLAHKLWWSKGLIPGQMEMHEFIPFLPSAADGPLFLIGHFALPHNPYRFDKECKSLGYASVFTSIQAYFDSKPGKDRFNLHQGQSLCAEKLLTKLIDGIKERDPHAIIIVQADHGSQCFFDPELLHFEELTKNNLYENFNILYAFHGPESLTKQLYDGFSPVNTFRLVFAWLDGQEPELLKHRSFYGVIHKKVLEENKARYVMKEWFDAPVPNKAAG